MNPTIDRFLARVWPTSQWEKVIKKCSLGLPRYKGSNSECYNWTNIKIALKEFIYTFPCKKKKVNRNILNTSFDLYRKKLFYKIYIFKR